MLGFLRRWNDRKMKRLKEDLQWWRRQAVTRAEHLEYWQGVSKFYREKWHEALSQLPEEKRLQLLGEDQSYIEHVTKTKPRITD